MRQDDYMWFDCLPEAEAWVGLVSVLYRTTPRVLRVGAQYAVPYLPAVNRIEQRRYLRAFRAGVAFALSKQ